MAFILIGTKTDALCDWLNVSKSQLRGQASSLCLSSLCPSSLCVSVSVPPPSSFSPTSPVPPPFPPPHSPSHPPPPLLLLSFPPCPLLHPPPSLSSSMTSSRLTVAQLAFQVPISTKLLPSVNHSASRDSCISHEWKGLLCRAEGENVPCFYDSYLSYLYDSAVVLVSSLAQLCVIPWIVSSVHGILQARILERVAIPFSRGSSWARGPT